MNYLFFSVERGETTVLLLAYLTEGGKKQEDRNTETEHPRDDFGTFYKAKGYGENQGSHSVSGESPGSSGSLNIFCAKLTAEVWVFVLYKCPHTSVFFSLWPRI